MDKIKVGIAGCLGRMGQELVKITTKDKRIKFVGGYDLKNSKTHSNDIFQGANIIIDFSSPAAIKGN
ncbi:MAG TPA: 4-hydroxy-tetrahydrodipicolinate reductase, partial [Pelagibacterales bacterium]|nr:4-hydroxy-tetrahydrodipicolinate reductase [Pelagibacterales bacterium]